MGLSVFLSVCWSVCLSVSVHVLINLFLSFCKIDALPEVVKAVEGKVDVFVDGGIRHGTDVLKALALGARAVFIGRPVLWGLAYQVGSELNFYF